MEVTDDREVAPAEIEYGDQTNTTKLDGNDAKFETRLSDVVDVSSSDPTVTPDSTAPSLPVNPQTPNSAGALQLTIEPGTFTGTNDGTDYPEVVEEFQRPNE